MGLKRNDRRMDTSEKTWIPHPRAANSTAAVSAPETRCRPERPGRGASRDGLTWPLGGLKETEAANQGRPRPPDAPPISYRRSLEYPDEGAPSRVFRSPVAVTEKVYPGESGSQRFADSSFFPGADPPTSSVVRFPRPSPDPVHTPFLAPGALGAIPYFGTGRYCRGPERGRKVTSICAPPRPEPRFVPPSP